jgi:hypothetical protein
VHGQEINSFRRKTRSKELHEFKLHRQEKFLYICDTLHMCEWDVRVLDIQEGIEHNLAPICRGGRGATPPELCGGPTGYRLMLKRQREGAAMSDPVRVEAGIQLLAEACPDQSARTWELLHTVLGEGFQSIDRRLHELGPLQSVKHLLWHGNTEEALERMGDLLMELSLVRPVRTLRRSSSTALMSLDPSSTVSGILL